MNPGDLVRYTHGPNDRTPPMIGIIIDSGGTGELTRRWACVLWPDNEEPETHAIDELEVMNAQD
jgi:hypothetical protein